MTNKAKAAYAKQLADPRWTAKRNHILERDNHKCRVIGCTVSNRLHVHHIKYTGRAWEAPDDDLITLCAAHHRAAHAQGVTLEGATEYPLDGLRIPHEFLHNGSFHFSQEFVKKYKITNEDWHWISVNKDSNGFFFVDLRAWGQSEW